MRQSSHTKKFIDALDGKSSGTPPIWLMRQAGRYLSEYREIRKLAPTFIDFCYSPKLATEATLQPIRRFGFDAAILFSDILVVPDALGQSVSFEQGEGPRLNPIENEISLKSLNEKIDLGRLEPVFETIDRLKTALPAETALIGFCGAPWTVASYMIAGRGTPDQAPARLFAYRYPDIFQKLIDLLVQASIDYLMAQCRAGVDAVQIFDSWAGVLPSLEFERWCLKPVKEIAEKVKAHYPEVRIIAFPRGVGTHLVDFLDCKAISALGIDTSADQKWVAANIQIECPVQGNLDPLALVAGGACLDREIDLIKSSFGNNPYIFNLGHGILPETPVSHVERLIERVRKTY